MPENLKEYVEQCEDAAELHEIAKEKFGEAIHNRTGLEKSKELVLAMIEKAEQGDTPESSTQDQKPAQRMLKNTRTGNTFTYTKALAKNKNMVEV